MSLTKEQLINTYIVNDCPVKREAYRNACNSTGILGVGPESFTSDSFKFIGVAYSYACLSDEVSAEFKQLHLSDLIDLENSKVYTTDPEVVRMYGKLCGVEAITDHEKHNSKIYAFDGFTVECLVGGYTGDEFDNEITEAQVRALYREKSGGDNKEEGVSKLKVDPIVYEEGMRNAMKKIAKSCGKTFGADVGYEDLPELVESLINKPKPKPKTRSEYVKVEMDTNDIAKAMIDGEVFYSELGEHEYSWGGDGFIDKQGDTVRVVGDYYRKQEVEVDWRDELESFVKRSVYLERDTNLYEAFTQPESENERKFDDDFLEMYRVVLRARGEIG